jgi:hypothetical protein
VQDITLNDALAAELARIAVILDFQYAAMDVRSMSG